MQLLSKVILCLLFFTISEGLRSQTRIYTDTAIITNDCNCKPSLPIELGIHTAIWGTASYVVWHNLIDFHGTPKNYINPWVFLVPPLLFVPMLSLAVPAIATSDCEASAWHTVWIGFSANTFAMLMYMGTYGIGHDQNITKFNLGKYIVLGLAPAIGSALLYNLFLDCPEGSISQHSLLITPTIGAGNSAALQLMLTF